MGEGCEIRAPQRSARTKRVTPPALDVSHFPPVHKNPPVPRQARVESRIQWTLVRWEGAGGLIPTCWTEGNHRRYETSENLPKTGAQGEGVGTHYNRGRTSLMSTCKVDNAPPT